MTRDERIVEAYRGGWRPPGQADLLPFHIRNCYVGEIDMPAEELAEAMRARMKRSHIFRVFVLCNEGKLYVLSRFGEIMDSLVRERPQLLVGCYAKGFEVGDLVEDLEAVRGGV